MSQKTGFIIQTQYLFLLTDILIFDLLVSPLRSDTHEQYAGKKMENQKSNESDWRTAWSNYTKKKRFCEPASYFICTNGL